MPDSSSSRKPSLPGLRALRWSPLLALGLVGALVAPGHAQLHPGLNPDVFSLSGAVSTTSLEGGTHYRTVGGDLVFPPFFLPRGTAFRVGAEVGFFSGPGTAGSARPLHLDGHFLWEAGDLLFPELPLGLLVSTGGELYYLEEAGSTLRRVELPLRLGLHYAVPLAGSLDLVPGAAFHGAMVDERVSLAGALLNDTGVHLHMEFGLTLRHRGTRALFSSVRLGDERFGNRNRIQVGLRAGF